METEFVTLAIVLLVIIVAAVWCFDAITDAVLGLLFRLIEPLLVSKRKKDLYFKTAMETLAESWRAHCDAGLGDVTCKCESCQVLFSTSQDRRDFLTGFYRGMAESLPDGTLWQMWAHRGRRRHALLLDRQPRLEAELRRIASALPDEPVDSGDDSESGQHDSTDD